MKDKLGVLIADIYSNGIYYTEAVRQFKKQFITHVLRSCNGNQSSAARQLGMHRNTLSRTIAELNLRREDWDPKSQLSGRLPNKPVQPAAMATATVTGARQA